MPADRWPSYEELVAENAQLRVTVEGLRAQVVELTARLGQSSRNSSKPPSSDSPFAKPAPKSLRGKSGRKPGGQPGHPGSTLALVANPDTRLRHEPGSCAGCGADLADAPGGRDGTAAGVRPAADDGRGDRAQLIARRCSYGATTCGSATQGVSAPVQRDQSALAAVCVPLAVIDIVEQRMPARLFLPAWPGLAVLFGLTAATEHHAAAMLRMGKLTVAWVASRLSVTSLEGNYLVAEQAFPNPLGVHALVWVGDTRPGSVDYAVTKTKETGYDLLELSLHDMNNLDVVASRRRLLEAGLRLVCSRGLAFDADISSEDLAVVERGEQLLHDSLRITAELGGTHLTGVLYSALGKYSHPLSDAGRRNVVAVLARLAQRARGCGVTVGLEVCNRYETNVVNTARQALALADDIGEDNVLLHLDTYHMNIEEDDLVRPVREVGERLGYVHIGENHRGYLGSGHLDFTAFFHALADIGYTGPITFESFSSTVITSELSQYLAIWRDLWNDSDDLARHARAFIARHLITATLS